MRIRRQLLSDGGTTAEIWPAFTDVMSTLALVLFMLVLLAFVRNVISDKRLQSDRKQIASSEKQLVALRSEIAIDRTRLDVSAEKLREQSILIMDSARQLEQVQTQLQSIAVLRVEVLTKLKQALEGELGSSGDGGSGLVSIGDNGNIVINESLVFEYGSYSIKKDARPLLDTFAKALGRVLADDDARQNIDTILIQGHTDNRGTVQLNWDLSAKRATAVLNYLFEANKTLADSYGTYFAAAAYSKFRPVDAADTEFAYQRNRRIEISVIPKDANLRHVIDDYVRNAALRPSPDSRP